VANPQAGILCAAVEDPALGPPVPAQKPRYVWIGPGKCVQGATLDIPDCRGTPAAGGSTQGLFGVVYEESNTIGGLQRAPITIGERTYAADKMLLI